MKMNNLLFPLFIMSLSACNIVDVPFPLYVEDTFSVTLVTGHTQDSNGEPIASYLIDYSYLGQGFEDVELPENLVIGGLFTLRWTGELQILESYPSVMTISGGKVISYSYEQPYVIKTSREELEYFYLPTDYIITDKEGHYQKWSEYKGDEVYVTEDLKMTRDNCGDCPKGANCAPCMIYYSGVYAFDPLP